MKGKILVSLLMTLSVFGYSPMATSEVVSKPKAVRLEAPDKNDQESDAKVRQAERPSTVIRPNDLGSETKTEGSSNENREYNKKNVEIDQATEILNRDMEFPQELPLKKVAGEEAPSEEKNGKQDLGEVLFNDGAENGKIPDESEINAMKIGRGDSPVKEKAFPKATSEDSIPVLVSSKSPDLIGGQKSSWRILVSLGLVLIFAVALAFGTKYWTRNRLGQQSQNKIRILTQHHLSPKKSLAIVQVAGESLLLGITEQNIQLLKPLSLIDDEIPESTPSHFYNELEAFDSTVVNAPEVRDRVQIQSSTKAIQSPLPKDEINPKSIQNLIADRLREMRSL